MKLVFGLVAFVLLCTLNSSGYRYGASDQAFYVPAVLARLDPALFPRDRALIASQAHLTAVDETTSVLARVTSLSLPSLFAGLYVLTLLLFALGGWLIGSRFYRERWTVVALLAALTLRHAIARTGTNTLEGYFHPRQLAFAFGLLAVAALLRRRLASAALLVLLAGFVHPTTALWFAVWVAAAAAVNEPRTRRWLGIGVAAGVLAGAWMLWRGPLAGRLVVMDAEWVATLSTKTYLFPLDWPAYAWLVNLAYIPVIVLIYRRRSAAGVALREERGFVAGVLLLAGIFAVSLPLNAARVALVVQLQIPRVFWMLDFLAVVYAVWALAEARARSAHRRPLVVATVIILLSLVRGTYGHVTRVPARPIARLDVASDDWGRVMAWARTTPSSTGWIADPLHAALYGTSVRVAGQRDVFVEEVKDTAIGMYDRAVAMRTRDRMRALGEFNALTPERARAIAAQYDMDYLVTERELELPQAFAAGALRVYALR